MNYNEINNLKYICQWDTHLFLSFCTCFRNTENQGKNPTFSSWKHLVVTFQVKLYSITMTEWLGKASLKPKCSPITASICMTLKLCFVISIYFMKILKIHHEILRKYNQFCPKCKEMSLNDIYFQYKAILSSNSHPVSLYERVGVIY